MYFNTPFIPRKSNFIQGHPAELFYVTAIVEHTVYF